MRNVLSRIIASAAFSLFVLYASCLCAQPVEQVVKVIVTPDHADWNYTIGEKVKFSISVFHYGNPLHNVPVRCEIKPEKMETTKKTTLTLKNGVTTIDGGTMKEPGFLRCWAYVEVDGKEYNGCGTAGFEPQNIKPTTVMPDDFSEFWDKAKGDASKIPLDAKMTLLPDRCTSTVNVYHVNVQNYRRNNRLYGILCIPKGGGSYPALLNVPGAGIRSYSGLTDMAEKGIITLQIGIHGIPVTLDSDFYSNLWAPLNAYWNVNLDDRDHYYYKRVYIGCVRAVDFIFSLPQFDNENLAVTGGSQGGALSIITAALDSRVKWIGLYCPALCDLTGYLHNRAGGWPHLFNKSNHDFNVKDDKIETSKYYDVANFARLITIPGLFSWGYNDTTCPPTSMYAAYNVVTGPKKLHLFLDARHWIYPEQREMTNAWLVNHLTGDGTMEP